MKQKNKIVVRSNEEFDAARVKTARDFGCSVGSLSVEVCQGANPEIVKVILQHRGRSRSVTWKHQDNSVPDNFQRATLDEIDNPKPAAVRVRKLAPVCRAKLYHKNAMAWSVTYLNGSKAVVPDQSEPSLSWQCWNASVTAQEAKQ